MSESTSLTSYDLIRQYLIHKVNGQVFKTKEGIDKEWAEITDGPTDALQDAMETLRGGGIQTDIPGNAYSRHYEDSQMAAQMLDGSWVGWTYWYGGGKHGCPRDMPWMEDAYPVTMREERRVVQVFTRAEL